MKRLKRNIKNYIMETYKNKLVALALLALGLLTLLVTSDGTFLLVFGMISICLFFATENYID